MVVTGVQIATAGRIWYQQSYYNLTNSYIEHSKIQSDHCKNFKKSCISFKLSSSQIDKQTNKPKQIYNFTDTINYTLWFKKRTPVIFSSHFNKY